MNALREEVKKAISQWVASLSTKEASTKCIYVNSAGYSPLQIKREVERQTAFGISFVSGLCELHERMVTKHPEASVVELIRGGAL